MASHGASDPMRRALQALFVEDAAVWNPACRMAEVRTAAAADTGVHLNTANGMFPARGLQVLPAFRAALEARFRASVAPLDFSDPRSVRAINGWVERETAGAIPRLLYKLEPNTALVLANAVHFKGEWTHPFDPALSAQRLFQPESGAAVERQTMLMEEFQALYREDENFQAIELPYGEGRFALTVVLPRPGMRSVDALTKLSADPSWLGAGGFSMATGQLLLPRMRLSYRGNVLPLLERLGLARALRDPDAFSGIAVPAPRLSKVIHAAELVLDEEGTEAAAATAAVFIKSKTPRFSMRVNRPFALAVRDTESGDILFAAWVDDPGDMEPKQ